MAATAAYETTQELADRYGDAWQRRDVEAILALHTADSLFHVHGTGDAAVGLDAVREALVAFYEAWPEPHFDTRRLLLGEDHWVLEWTLTACAAGTISGGGLTLEGAGTAVRFEGVDVVTVTDGLVSAKDVYIDALAVQRQLEGGPDA